MNKVVLDTDILSEILKGKDATVRKNASAYLDKFGVFTTTVISVAELVKGFLKPAIDCVVQVGALGE